VNHVSVPLSTRLADPIAIAAVVACLTGCGTAGAAHGSSDGGLAASGHGAISTWLFAARALRQVRVDAGVRTQLNRTRILEILRVGQQAQGGPHLLPTMKFASYASMKNAMASGGLPRWVKAVLYDNEAWSATPVAEQRAPGRYMALAARLAHRHHLLFMASPGLDLTRVLQPGVTRRSTTYLELRLATQAAAAADVVDIQAQSLERSTHAYVNFVRQAAVQARGARRGVTVLAGISSNPTGSPVSATQLIRAMTGVRPYVDGYWMNIPARGPLCPRCNQPRPDLAIAAIRSLSR
jgi:hypothetical protein